MKLKQLIDNFKGRKIVVLADMVADVFIYAEISRVSREAPVLILSQREKKVVPGGGANAVHNLSTLGAKPLPVGIVGDDLIGLQLIEYFSSRGIDTTGIMKLRSYQTPTKTRILAGTAHSHQQQVLRLDEGLLVQDNNHSRSIQRRLETRMKNAEAILISDYGYGTVTPAVTSKLRGLEIPVSLDSRFVIGNYQGMTAITPNEPEVEAALDIKIGSDAEKLEWAGRTLLRRFKHDSVLITRGKDGMALFERKEKTTHIPIHGNDEIVDVTGAGDTVIATLTLALAAGGSFKDAANLANYAAGIVVMKDGTRAVTVKELSAAVAKTP